MTTTDDAVKSLAGDLAAVDGSSLATLTGAVRAAGARATGIITPNVAPTAAFAATVAGLSVSLDASASADRDGTVASYAWDFGDGTTGAGMVVAHTYKTGGTFAVKLTVTDNLGANASVGQAVVVVGIPVPVQPLTVAKVLAAGTPTVGQPVELTAIVHNNSAAAIAAPGVAFYVAGTKVAWAAADTVAAGADVTLDTSLSPYTSPTHWTPTAAGTYNVDCVTGSGGTEVPATKLTAVVVVAAAPVPVPVPTPTGTRDATKWPYAVNSPWNLPIGSGAQYGPSLSGGAPFVLADGNVGYEPAVYVAKATDPTITVSVNMQWGGGSNPFPVTLKCPAGAQVPNPSGGDMHMTIIQPSGPAVAFWAFVWTSPTTATCGAWAYDDQKGSGWAIGYVRAAGVAASAGSIRAEEAAALHIPHALGFGCPGEGVYGGSAGGPVWPAVTFDHGGEGSLLAIPPSTPKPSNLSPAGSAIWDALRDYGMYDVDTTGGNGVAIYQELHVPESFADQANGDITTIMRACRLVTNATQAAPKGPGTPIAPLAPAV